MTITTREIIDRDTWLAWRRDYVGASNVGALFNVHPYMTALKLYVEKRGAEFPNEETGSMRRGRLMESTVGAAVADERPEWNLDMAKTYLVDTDLRLAATPDFWITGPRGRGTLQAKTAMPSVYERDWHGGARPPMWIVLQCLTEMMLAGVQYGAIAVLRLEWNDLKCSIFDVERHAEAEARIVEAVQKFWRDVEEGNEPTPDYGRDADLARFLVPRETSGKSVDLSGDNELAAALEDRRRVVEEIRILTARKDEVESMVRFRLGDAEAAELADWRITYKTHHRAEAVIPAKDIRTLRINPKKESP